MSDTPIPQEMQRSWDPNDFDNDQCMKVLMTIAGYVEGAHRALEGVRRGYDSRDPRDHNVEQAQIALETVTMRINQLTAIITQEIKEEADG